MRSGTIIVTDANGVERERALRSGSVRIGSAPDNDMVVSGPDIAPYHALITCNAAGLLVIEIGVPCYAGQGGMRLTFNLEHVTSRRDLAWIGSLVVSYQPAAWECRTQPISLADLAGAMSGAQQAQPAARQSADETALLQALLNHGAVRQPADAGAPPDAPTIGMPLLALAARRKGVK